MTITGHGFSEEIWEQAKTQAIIILRLFDVGSGIQEVM
jgi:hypothetical protein